jgi:ATP-dependent Clp protease protease subunit
LKKFNAPKKYFVAVPQESEFDSDCDCPDDETMSFPFMMPFGFPPQDNSSLKERGVILLTGGLTKETVEPVIQRMWALHFDDEFQDDIQLIINSPGGQGDIMWALIDTMEAIRMDVRTIALGEIMSAGAMVFIAGDDRIMSPNSVAMIHNFYSGRVGDYAALVAARKGEDMYHEMAVKHFLKHSKYKTKKEVIKNILKEEDHFLTAKEMLKHGLADGIFKPIKRQLGSK